jgi:hypothetical protein
MGRNGLMGNFQGFDAFGKVSYYPQERCIVSEADE